MLLVAPTVPTTGALQAAAVASSIAANHGQKSVVFTAAIPSLMLIGGLIIVRVTLFVLSAPCVLNGSRMTMSVRSWHVGSSFVLL